MKISFLRSEGYCQYINLFETYCQDTVKMLVETFFLLKKRFFFLVFQIKKVFQQVPEYHQFGKLFYNNGQWCCWKTFDPKTRFKLTDVVYFFLLNTVWTKIKSHHVSVYRLYVYYNIITKKKQQNNNSTMNSLYCMSVNHPIKKKLNLNSFVRQSHNHT